MKLRLNQVQVGFLNTGTGLQSQSDYSTPGFGAVLDSTTGGLGSVFGEKRMTWVSGYSSAPTDGIMLQMEQFLAQRYNIPGITQGGSKPNISNHEFEYDVLSLSLNQSDTVTAWTDTSPELTDATIGNGDPEYEDGAWEGALECVRLFQPAFGGSFDFDGTPFIGSDVTLFWVFRTFVLGPSPNGAFMGGSSFTDFQQMLVAIQTDGSIVFGFGTNGGVTLEAISAPGLVAADGACHVMTCVHSSTAGKTIRLDGVQVAVQPLATGNLTAFPTARVGNIANLVGIADSRFAWVAGYSVAASALEIAQMEAFLTELWCTPVVPSQPWVPAGTQLPIATDWTAP